jgi:hypothetical protein
MELFDGVRLQFRVAFDEGDMVQCFSLPAGRPSDSQSRESDNDAKLKFSIIPINVPHKVWKRATPDVLDAVDLFWSGVASPI